MKSTILAVATGAVVALIVAFAGVSLPWAGVILLTGILAGYTARRWEAQP